MLLFHTDLYESLFPAQNYKVFATFYYTILTFSSQFWQNLRIARYKLNVNLQLYFFYSIERKVRIVR